RDESASDRRQHLAGNAVGVVLELIDALAEDRRLVPTLQHVLECPGSLGDHDGMTGKQFEEPFLPWQEGAKPTEHGASTALKRPQARPRHKTVIDGFVPKGPVLRTAK